MVTMDSPQAKKVLFLVEQGTEESNNALLGEVKGGFGINTVLDRFGRNALMLFAQKENAAGVTLCVKNGADFNI